MHILSPSSLFHITLLITTTILVTILSSNVTYIHITTVQQSLLHKDIVSHALNKSTSFFSPIELI